VDGVSRTLGQLFTTLRKQGIDFCIYSPMEPSPEYAWSDRVRVVRSFAFPLYRDYRISMPDKRWLRADLDAFQPDLIHICTPTPAPFWAQGYARSHGIPVAGSFHTDFVGYMSYYRAGLLQTPAWKALAWFYNRCEGTFAPSRNFVEDLRRRGFQNVQLWSRGIDCDLYSPRHRDPRLRAGLGLNEDTPLLLMVSRLVKEKDLADLIGMDRSLKQRGLKYRLALVGDGPFRAELERGLPDAYFAGQQVGMELARWYASGDIFVFPSTTETFGNVVQEAMASGLSTVVVNKGGPPSLLEDGVSGLMARAKDPADLAVKVAGLIEDQQRRRRLGEEARALAMTRTWDAVNGALISAYEAMASRDRIERKIRISA
jgi:glycosyltransferase involved in cell wall biosynthesis